MELEPALALATELMVKHGLIADGWQLATGTSRTKLGTCNWTRKTIRLSRVIIAAAPLEAVEQVIFHELAHALVGHTDQYGRPTGHGRIWAAKAAELGYVGERETWAHYMEPPETQAFLAAASKLRPRVDIKYGSQIVTSSGRTGRVLDITKSVYKYLNDEDGSVWSASIGTVQLTK